MVFDHDDAKVFDGIFAFMVKSGNEDDEEKVTLSDINEYLKTYYVRRLKNLENVLMDFFYRGNNWTRLYETQFW